MSADFGEEPRDGEYGHDGEGNVGLLHLLLDLVLEVARVVEGGLVEDKVVRGGCEDVVYNDTEEPNCVLAERLQRVLQRRIPCDEIQRQQLASPVVARPLAHVGILGRGDGEELRRRLVLPGCVRQGVGGRLFSETRCRRI